MYRLIYDGDMVPHSSTTENLPGATLTPATVADDSEMAMQLRRLQRRSPSFHVWLEDLGEHIAFAARRRSSDTHPHTVMTDDPEELEAALTGTAVFHCGGELNAGDEPPQSVADDYPGWVVRIRHGVWMASCPAITVLGSSSADLRAAIDREIAGDDA